LLYARGITRANFQQEKIPTASGALLVLYSTITWAALLLLTTSYSAETTLGSSFQQAVLLVSGSFAMAVWGWQDDRSQEKEIKGFRGHLRTLIKEGRATSGLTKALGGVSTSFIVSLLLSKGLLEV
ncbi:hypothetical protein MXD81_13180, partial [Microbacteriaceae bacterium K1510]|nr:hypothetical protein [Microbacteriaceae bacterium K1510]